jgi:hypothetical protein
MRLISIRSRFVMAALGVALSLSLGTSQAQTAGSVTGGAYGASVKTLTASLLDPGATGSVALPATGGIADNELTGLNVAGVLTTGTVSPVTTGVIGENADSAQSYAAVQDVNILNGVITARALLAMASSEGNGLQALSNGAGTTVVDLLINGVPTGVVSPAPNTQIAVPGVGTLILNEQTPTGNGTTTTGITVTALHLVQTTTDPLLGTTTKTGDIIVAVAQSGASFVR